VFVNGAKVEFTKNGEWKDVECKYGEVPAAIVPQQIRDYVAKNYPDRKSAAFLGVYECGIHEFITNYIVPQDNANRCDTRWFMLGDSERWKIQVKGLQPLCFRIWPYGEEDLEGKEHAHELPERDFINPDNALERTNQKFLRRFNYLEEHTLKKGIQLKEMSLEEMDVIWDEAKKLGL
jgi:hypothetical protein